MLQGSTSFCALSSGSPLYSYHSSLFTLLIRSSILHLLHRFTALPLYASIHNFICLFFSFLSIYSYLHCLLFLFCIASFLSSSTSTIFPPLFFLNFTPRLPISSCSPPLTSSLLPHTLYFSAPHPLLHLSQFHILAGAGVLLQRNKSQLNPLSLSRCSNELRSATVAWRHSAVISLTLNDSY